MKSLNRPRVRRAALVCCTAAAALGLTLPAADAAARAARASVVAGSPDGAGYGENADALAFAQELAERRQLDADWVRAQLAQARYLPRVARLIAPPPSGAAKNWAAYRDRFIEPVRIRAGIDFWREHEAWLLKAQARYGVPPEVIIGILGVETMYGRHMGDFRVIDSLATLAFDYPDNGRDRSPFFRAELGDYLAMCRQQGMDPLAVRGSYAGAIGLPQFMPSSIERFAVDFDGDGITDLRNSVADAIGSVAHYLAEHGWQPGLPPRFAVTPPTDAAQRATLLAPDIVPSFSAGEFTAHGALLGQAAQAAPGKLALVALENGDAAPSYVAGTQNFYVITRYNRSSYYALAVIELGETIADVRQRVQ